jgi:H+/Cl- antiporter ClcA
MSGLICILIGGAYNTYRIYAISSKSDDSAPNPFQGAFAGFVSGAILFGFPMWGTYAIVNHLANGT